jgi:NADH dehydrogenase [ubiquinone] 1 alpha subcomplex assembly factor 1
VGSGRRQGDGRGVAVVDRAVRRRHRGLFRNRVEENSGGFASVRSGTLERAPELCEGVELRLLTDGKSYKVNLRTDDRFDGFQYQARIRCDGGAWSTVRIPFLEFTPVLRGRPVAGVAPLEPANLSGVGLMISEGQEGSFRLEIRTISAYRKV